MNKTDLKNIFFEVVQHSAQVNPAFMSWSESAISEAMDLYQFEFLKSERGEIATFICFQKNSELLEILALGTRIQFQRCGYSERLLRQLVLKYSDALIKLSLEVHAENNKAIALYQKCGFKTVRIRKKYYSDGQDALVMDYSYGS